MGPTGVGKGGLWAAEQWIGRALFLVSARTPLCPFVAKQPPVTRSLRELKPTLCAHYHGLNSGFPEYLSVS